MGFDLARPAERADAQPAAPGWITLEEVLGGPTRLERLFQRELIRSRRFDRPASLLALAADPISVATARRGLVRPVRRSRGAENLWSAMAVVLAQDLRRFDLVGRQADGLVLVLSPETDRAGASLLEDRLARRFARVDVRLLVGSAFLPDDGTSLEELTAVARGRLAPVGRAQRGDGQGTHP
jgi:hypothetical protein